MRYKLEKRYLNIFILCLIVAIGSSFLTYAATPSDTYTISSGPQAGAPTYTVSVIAGTYYAKDQNGFNEFSGSVFETVMQSAIAACSDYDSIMLQSGTYTLLDEIDDQGKDGIHIYSKSAILSIDNKNNDKHGFLLSDVVDWIIEGIRFQATIVYDGQAGHESSAIEMDTCVGIIIRNCYFDHVNGYAVRVENSPSSGWSTNLTVTDNIMLDCGHNFFSGTNVNHTIISRNWCYKSNGQLDSEQIWLASWDFSGTITEVHHNVITDNHFIGGSNAIVLACDQTGDADDVSYNVFSNNYCYRKNDVLTSAQSTPVLYLGGNFLTVENNQVIDEATYLDAGQGSVLLYDGGDTALVGMKFNYNTIKCGNRVGISTYSTQLNGSQLCHNTVIGTLAGETSISFGTIDETICVGNLGARTVTIDGTNTLGYSAGNQGDITSLR